MIFSKTPPQPDTLASDIRTYFHWRIFWNYASEWISTIPESTCSWKLGADQKDSWCLFHTYRLLSCRALEWNWAQDAKRWLPFFPRNSSAWACRDRQFSCESSTFACALSSTKPKANFWKFSTQLNFSKICTSCWAFYVVESIASWAAGSPGACSGTA